MFVTFMFGKSLTVKLFHVQFERLSLFLILWNLIYFTVVKVMKKVTKKDLSESYKVPDNGFGTGIKWTRLNEGLKEASAK